ncbi:flagellar filament capping protein FliD [Panacagrimonas sp.]|uniref:flagellar filament capping protein FliD n=1 Tax=Panacagrimonas sp. TaxID=2480088 RepID=UPI003B522EB9
MAISSAGIGSGLDVASLVAQLVSAERAPQESRLQATQSRINVTLSALGTFKAGLTQFQSAVDALKGADSAIGRLSTTLSDESVLTATAGSGAAAGRYEVEVLSQARSHKMASEAFASGSESVVGNGTVSIQVGADSFEVELVDGANTLAALRDRINAAGDNPGVTAALLTEDAGTRLVLTASATGTHKAMVVGSAASSDGSDLFGVVTVQAATDAQIRIDGFTYTSGSNTVAGALEGVSLNLLKAEPGTTVTLDVQADRTVASDAIQQLVRTYNAVVAVVKKQAGYDAATQTGGPLMGDIAVRSSLQQLRSIIGGTVGTGDFATLAQLGITTATDGTLTVDSTRLSNALISNGEAVGELFSGPTGLAARLSGVLDGYLGTDGRLEAQTERLQARLDGIDDQTEALDRRMAAVEARYRRQFTALDALVGQMQTTSSYLTQQLANLPGASSGN